MDRVGVSVDVVAAGDREFGTHHTVGVVPSERGRERVRRIGEDRPIPIVRAFERHRVNGVRRSVIDLLRGEADLEGRFTGGAYPTFAAAGAYWLAQGPKTEMAEWALRWARESPEDWWGPWERASALTFWGGARIPSEHPSVDLFLEGLRDEIPAEGSASDLGLTLRTLELIVHFGA